MSSIIPYAAQELAKPQNAALAADLFYEAGKAAHGMYTSYKSRPKKKGRTAKRKFGAADLGDPTPSNNTRRVESEIGVVGLNNKTLGTRDLIRIEKNVAANEAINKRNRDMVLHKGVKVCFTIKSRLQVPVFFNWAVVIPKAQNTVSSDNLLRGNNTERDVAINNQLTFLDSRCLGINTDLYKVVKRKKMLILPDSDKSATVSEGRDFRLIEEYFKTNRQLYFAGDTAAPLQNMHMVWWCDFYNSTTGGGLSQTVDISYRIINYFNDVP